VAQQWHHEHYAAYEEKHAPNEGCYTARLNARHDEEDDTNDKQEPSPDLKNTLAL